MKLSSPYARPLGQVPAGWSRIYMSPRPMNPLVKGMANDQTRDLQLLLNTFGYAVPVSGSFDAPTEVAVKIIQGKLGQAMSGQYTPTLDSTVLDNYQAKFNFKQSVVIEAGDGDRANVQKVVPKGYVAPSDTGPAYQAPLDPVPGGPPAGSSGSGGSSESSGGAITQGSGPEPEMTTTYSPGGTRIFGLKPLTVLVAAGGGLVAVGLLWKASKMFAPAPTPAAAMAGLYRPKKRRGKKSKR